MAYRASRFDGRRIDATRRTVARFCCLLAAGAPGCAASNPPPAPEPTVSVPPVAYAPVVPMPSTSSEPELPPSTSKTNGFSWGEDLRYLASHGPIIQLESPEQGVVAVSAKYQARVMTSAVSRDGMSLGYINRSFIDAAKTGTAFDNYGGEDRFWLGPEGGQFSLYFAAGERFDFANWQTPTALQQGEWSVIDRTSTSVVFSRFMRLANRAGAVFELEIKRTIRVLTNQEVLGHLRGVTTLGPVKWVGFESSNQVTNKGTRAWSKKDGLLSIWILGMFNPAPDMNVVVPFEARAQGPVVNDRYFGPISSERLRVFADQGFLTFKCDGQSRGKIGLGPDRAKSWLGSYSESGALLTLVNFDRREPVKDYVNNMWEQQSDPFSGDVVNSYNDGPVEVGKSGLGGFYELETSSPAAALKPGQSLTHVHRTLHFVGARAELDPLAKASLGVSLDRVLEAVHDSH